MTRRSIPILALALSLFSSGHVSAQAVLDQPSITLDAAVKMVNACEALAKSKGWKVSIWVVDDNALVVHMKHMEEAPIESIQTAQMKAKSTKALLSSTDPNDPKSSIGKMMREPRGQVMAVLLESFPDGGGLPVMVGGKFVGAIGVAGADGAFDAQCAQAGLDAITKTDATSKK